MDLLKAPDVITLSIFNCKVCRQRLRSPIFQVDVFGNICGTCHVYSAYTNVKRNTDVEILISKLYVPCNFAGNGCKYEGPYDKTINHEEICRFRSRRCPFDYAGSCDFEFVDSEDIVEHIRIDHDEDITKVDEDEDFVDVENPTEFKTKLFYLLQVRKKLIILRIMLKPLKDRIYYIAYHIGEAKFSLSLTFKRRQVMLTTKHESECHSKFDTRNAFKINSEDCELSVRIRFPIRNETVRPNPDDIWHVGDRVGALCGTCFGVCEETINYCNSSAKVVCRACQRRCKCGTIHNEIKLGSIGVHAIFQCTNAGCQQKVFIDEYDVHRLYHCSFNKKTHHCGSEGCEWRGCFKELVQHNLKEHLASINQKIHSVKVNTFKLCYFVNDDDVFLHEYILRENKLAITAVKLTEPYWSNSYSWTVRMKSMFGIKTVVLKGDYSISGCMRKVNVEEYMNNDTLTVESYTIRN